MKIDRKTQKSAKKLFGHCFEKDKLSNKKMSKLIKKLREVPARQRAALLSALKKLVELEQRKKTALVQSAKSLGPVAEVAMEMNLKKKFGDDLRVIFETKDELIGGVRVRVGDDVWDGSVRNKIDRLVSRMT